MENSLAALRIYPVKDFIISKWGDLHSKPLFTTPDVRDLVDNISDAVESMLNLNQEIQGPNYAIIGARGTGKTWLMERINILLNMYFKEMKKKAQSFYCDMSNSTKLPFGTSNIKTGLTFCNNLEHYFSFITLWI